MPQDLCTCCFFYLECSFQGSLFTIPLPSSGLGSSILELSGFSHGRRNTVSVVGQEICFRNWILHSCRISLGSESLEGWIQRIRRSLTSSPEALVQDSVRGIWEARNIQPLKWTTEGEFVRRWFTASVIFQPRVWWWAWGHSWLFF